jgi:nucleoside-diphosphate-sugar epimerase
MAAGAAPDPAPIINVGGGASITMLEVVKLAERLTGLQVPLAVGDRQAGDVAVTGADLTVARESLDYRAAVTIEEGMARHAEWMTALGPQGRADWRSPREAPCAS